jgi:type III secretion regulatory protein HpaA
MSIPRIGGSYLPPLLPAAPETPRPSGTVTQTDQPTPQQLLPQLPRLRRHVLGQAARSRATGRKKRGADNPHGADLSAESEDLLMMLEQHLTHDDKDVTKSGERGGRDQGSSSQGRDPGGGGGGDFARQHAATGDEARNGIRWTMHVVPRPVRDETRLLVQWRAAAAGKGPLARAEHALLAVPAAARRGGTSGTDPAASPTYPILAIVREFLAIPEGDRTRPATLANVRDRLLAAAAARAGGSPANVGRPLSDAEESVNLLLPIVLLNLGRHRTREGRAIGISSLAALIRRGRGW